METDHFWVSAGMVKHTQDGDYVKGSTSPCAIVDAVKGHLGLCAEEMWDIFQLAGQGVELASQVTVVALQGTAPLLVLSGGGPEAHAWSLPRWWRKRSPHSKTLKCIGGFGGDGLWRLCDHKWTFLECFQCSDSPLGPLCLKELLNKQNSSKIVPPKHPDSG